MSASQSKFPDFQDLVDSYYEALYRFAFSLARHPGDAADLTQQTFAVWAEKGHQMRDPGKVKSWLFTTLYREFLARRRQNQRYHYDEFLPERHSDETEESYVSRIDAEVLMAKLAELDEIHRTPLALFYLEDYSYKEISEILDVPIGTVMSRLNRAKQQLRDNLTQHLKSADLLSFPTLDSSAQNG